MNWKKSVGIWLGVLTLIFPFFSYADITSYEISPEDNGIIYQNSSGFYIGRLSFQIDDIGSRDAVIKAYTTIDCSGDLINESSAGYNVDYGGYSNIGFGIDNTIRCFSVTLYTILGVEIATYEIHSNDFIWQQGVFSEVGTTTDGDIAQQMMIWSSMFAFIVFFASIIGTVWIWRYLTRY